ncbi:MAG: type II toxin-antitoxin system VapC family toxin [Candidatus Aminicenantes bacterium]|nr:type II toxin-antitoxin system VapC family toxin [Candidatus Aminicenantes bacterium]
MVDNSVVMSWCFKDEANRYSESILDRLNESTVYVPSIWPLEVVNVLLVAERKNIIGRADGVRFLELLLQLPIHIEYKTLAILMKDIYRLAGEHGLSSYDASYLDLAMKKGLPLATQNKKLRKAAAKMNVPMLG